MNKRFDFPLRKALEWYRQSLAAEKATLQNIVAEVYALDRMMEVLERRRLQEQAGFQRDGTFLGRDLAGLTLFLASIRDQLIHLKASRVSTQAKLVEQRRSVEAGHRRLRLLEQLEERRHSDWRRETSIEEDSQASELFQAAAFRKSALENDAAADQA